MPPETIDEQLTKHLTDIHSIEEQAIAQLRRAPDIAGDEVLAGIYRDHLAETEEQERLVRGRLEAREADPSKLKDLVAYAGGVGMILFAKANPDTPGKLAAHAFSYEHMELAAYDLLALVADRAGDGETAALARSIREQEAAMAGRIAENFDRSVDASLEALDPDDLEKQLVKYLADAHALEAQGVQLLEQGPAVIGEPGLARIFAEHLEETRSHQARLEARLEAHGGSRNALQDAVLRLGGMNVGAFFGAQPDTPAKLAGFAFAFEHIEIGGHEQLKRVAARAGDDETVRIVEGILVDERAQAERVRGRFEAAVEATLEGRDLSESPQ
jgi:ferritin-like metal-binding protein YciE